VIARFAKIVAERGTNDDASVLKYWKSFGVAGKGGVIVEREFSIRIDGMVKDGTLKPGQLSFDRVYDDRFNPFAAEGAAAVGPQR
jgi:hypothetical protein